MIPRYDPTYRLRDLFGAWRKCSTGDPESELRARLKDIYRVRHAFLFDHARTALFAVLKAHGRPGDVLMPAYNCIVVPEAVESAGYRPRFVDIDRRSLGATRGALAKALTPDTTAVLPTHMFGIPCDVEEVVEFGREHGLLVIEDAAPAMGAEVRGKYVGLFGDAAIISFQATKVIAGEDGGALLTDNDELADKVSRLLDAARAPYPGWLYFLRAALRKIALRPLVYRLVIVGYRALGKEVMYEVVRPSPGEPDKILKRCPRFSSALALVQLDRLPENLERRRRLARIYFEGLASHPDITLPTVPEQGSPAWIQFPISVRDKRGFYRHMKKHGVDMSWTYRYSCAESYGRDDFPEALNAARTVLGLPTYPSLTDKAARHICDVAKKYTAAE